jgi:hypothetical protein
MVVPPEYEEVPTFGREQRYLTDLNELLFYYYAA